MNQFHINLSELSESELAALYWMLWDAQEREDVRMALAGWYYGNMEKVDAYIASKMPARIHASRRN